MSDIFKTADMDDEDERWDESKETFSSLSSSDIFKTGDMDDDVEK